MKPLPEAVQKEIAALAAMSDEDIEYSDIPATTHEDWIGAVRGRFYRPAAEAPEHGQKRKEPTDDTDA